MSSFLSRLKSGQGSGNASSPTSPVKNKGQDAAPVSARGAIVQSPGAAKADGSDKFFGMYNPSNTCYCNSVLQCLYFSDPFRENILGFPAPTQLHAESSRLNPRPDSDANPKDNGPGAASSPSPLKLPTDARNAASQRTPSGSGTTAATSEKAETFDERKKQILAAGPILRMEAAHHEQYGMDESLFSSLKDLFEDIISSHAHTGVVVPQRFLDTLRAEHEIYRGVQHQDAHEFLNLVLNEAVEKVEAHSKKADASVDSDHSQHKTSWVRDLFEGTLTSETRCLTCETVSQRDEIFLDLSVDLEEHSSVSSCLQRFSQEEMLRDRNKFYCDKCYSLQEAEKRMKIRKLPKTLALHLKRFKYVEDAAKLQKLFHRVVFPFHLRLFNTTDDAEDPDRLYELYAIIVHLGSTPFHGHYVSIIKTKHKGWLLFDDELVLPVDANYIKKFFGGDPRNPACAYVLFYQQTTVEAAFQEPYANQESPEPLSQAQEVAGAGLASPTTPATDDAGFVFGQGSPPMRPSSADDRELVAMLESPTSYQNPARHTPRFGHLSSVDSKEPIANLELPPSISGFSGLREARQAPELPAKTGPSAPSESTGSYSESTKVSDSHPEPSHSAEEERSPEKPSTARTHSKRSGGLGRFRTGSFSMRTKGRLWGSSQKHEGGDEPETHEDDTLVRSPEKENTGLVARAKPKFLTRDKAEHGDTEEAQPADKSDALRPPEKAPEKEKSGFSRLMHRSDKAEKPAKPDHKDAAVGADDTPDPDKPENSSANPGDKAVRARASRFGIGRKKSGNPLA